MNANASITNLERAADCLVNQHGFDVPPADLEQDARRHGNSVYPLLLYIAWLRRTQEAQSLLLESDTPLLGQKSDLVAECTFLARLPAHLHLGWVKVKILDIIGKLLQVQRVDESNRQHSGTIDMITLDHVASQDRLRVELLWRRHPNHTMNVSFGDE